MNLLATHFKRTRARALKKITIYILKNLYLLASGKNLTQPSFRGDFHLIFSTSEARWTCITHCTRARVYLNIIDIASRPSRSANFFRNFTYLTCRYCVWLCVYEFNSFFKIIFFCTYFWPGMSVDLLVCRSRRLSWLSKRAVFFSSKQFCERLFVIVLFYHSRTNRKIGMNFSYFISSGSSAKKP